MGGVSDGRFKINDEQEHGVFRYTVAGEQRRICVGSFDAQRKLDLRQGDSIVARVRGDGREYSLNLYVPRDSGRYSFRHTFETKKGEWIEVSLPVDKFVATFHGREFPDQKLDPSRVNSVGFRLGDKKAGPFKLEVDWIKVTKAE